MRREFTAFVIGLATLTVGAGGLAAKADDSIKAMCAKAEKAMPGQREGCECALQNVAADTDPEEFSLYASVGEIYFANMAKGMPMAEAWDAAARTVGGPLGKSLVEMLQVTNPIGAKHQAALANCQ